MSSRVPRRPARLAVTAALTISCYAFAQVRPDALVLSGSGTYTRANDESALALHPGEILFAGDHVHITDMTELLLCPAGRIVSLPAQAIAEIAKNQIKFGGRVQVPNRSTPPCEFPEFDKAQRSGNYHLGASLFTKPALQPQGNTVPAPRTGTDVVDLLAKLKTAESNKVESDALAISTTLASYWPEATGWKARLFRHEEAVAASKGPVRRGQGAYAIIIGISQYRNPAIPHLDYAHLDAQLIYAYLTNARGPTIPANHVTMLINGQATLSAIQDAFDKVKRDGAETLFVFIASHGLEAGREGYIVANDTNPQNAVATAISLSKINDDITSELTGVKTVFAWIDACHSGHIKLSGLDNPPGGVLFGLAASRATQNSFESPILKHGVFTWYLDQALNGGAATKAKGQPTVFDLVSYLRENVYEGSKRQQTPEQFGNVKDERTLASLNLRDTHTPLPPTDAISDGAPVGRRDQEEDDPLLALENAGQDVVLRYLEGDESPVSRTEFVDAQTDFASARKLAPESLWLEAREDFCAGRVAVFDKRYDQASSLLDRAIRLDPGDALAYNALGVAWLQQADYTRALAAFDDAIRRAPRWAYAWHNRALAYTQAGNYASAIRAYRHAMEIAPQYSYLPYNLGVLYQTLNRRKDAESSYRKAMELAPNRAEPHNAMGTLLAAEGKRDAAESEFRRALALDPNFEVARQNLNALLAQPRKR